VLNLTPLDDFPSEASEGDLFVGAEAVVGEQFKRKVFSWCYFDGEWRGVASYSIPFE
jgi:hypothetical protein